jgi:hypothetical protein
MEIDELNALFDIEDEAQEGVVDPDVDATDEGPEDEGEELAPEDSGEEVANPQQSTETNHMFAEFRKNSEQQIRQANEQTQRAQDEVTILLNALKQFGYEGTAQEVADEIEAARSQQTVEEVRAERERMESDLNQRIENHPAVVAAKNMQHALIQQRNQEMFNRELSNIQRINPEIKSLADLRNLGPDQNYFDFLIKEKGLHIDQAYKEIFGNRTNTPAPKVDTKSNVRTFNGAANQGGVDDVPADEMKLCMELMPGASKEEIRKFYSKNKKGR